MQSSAQTLWSYRFWYTVEMGKATNNGALTWAGIAVAVLGILVPIAWNLYDRSMSLSATILSEEKVRIGELIGDRYKVVDLESSRSDGIEIESISVVRLLIRNDGRRPIRSSDIEVPVVIRFSGDAERRVMSAFVARSSPESIGAIASVGDDVYVELHVPLLNPGDSIEVVVSGEGLAAGEVMVHGRIAGVPEIRVSDQSREIPEPSRKFTAIDWVVIGASVISGVMVIGAFMAGADEKKGLVILDAASVPSENHKDQFVEVCNRLTATIDTMTFKRRVGSLLRSEIGNKDEYRKVIASARDIVESELRGTKQVGSVFVVMLAVGIVYIIFWGG